MTFAQVLEGAERLDGGFALSLPEDWHQGRTAYGGFSSALALSAARQVGGDALPPLRSAQLSFVGPLSGPVEVKSRVLRKGKNATWLSAEVLREGQAGLLASFVFMGAVQSTLQLHERPLPEGLIACDQAQPAPFRDSSPLFLRNHFEVRFALPRVAERRPELCWWLRVKDHAAIDPMTGLLLIADALPPGVMPLLPPHVPVSTMTWQCNLLTPQPQTEDGWWLLRSRGDYAQGGCSSQIMEIWNTSGEPVMAGLQSVALFG